MAVPRLRPLDRLPAPFGRDWAIIPPNISLRVELKALYAAVLRTFCVNTAAFRALCQWDARRLATRESTSRHTPQTGDASATPSAPDATQEATNFVASSAPATRYRSSSRRTALAGGACAVGGAAVLAWVAISHSTQHQTVVRAGHEDRAVKQIAPEHEGEDVAQPAPAMPSPDATARAARSHGASPAIPNRPALARLPVDAAPPIALTTPASAAPLKPASSAPKASSAVWDTNSSSLSEQRPGHTSPQASSPNRSITAASRNGHAQARDADNRVAGKLHRATPRAISKSQASDHSVSPRTDARIEAPAFNPRSVAKPSSAGGFSPFAPATLGVDEYASVRLSANTHLRDIAPARSQSRAINTDTADWTNRMSQRRVTEAPDEFVK